MTPTRPRGAGDRAGTALALALALAAGGCGAPKIVPVSGTVTVNGKPYPNAVVQFQPAGGRDNPNPGRGSAGVTDAAGRYALVYDGEQPGALAGKHRVRVFTQFGADIPDTEGDPAAADRVFKEQAAKAAKEGRVRKGKKLAQGAMDPIPAEWNEASTKEFEVPAGGTDQANFAVDNPAFKN